MAKRYGAFLLRWWRRDNGTERIEIEHVQSDAKTVVTTAPAALVWLEVQMDREVILPGPPAATRDNGTE
jgi:hypothetical protein